MAKFAFDALAGEPAEDTARPCEMSLFRSIDDTAPQTVTLDDLRDLVADGSCRETVMRVRAEDDKKKRDAIKRGLPCVTVSGVFAGGHRAEHLSVRSGLICVDFDSKDNPCMAGCADQWRDKLAEDEFVRLAFVSAGGDGVAAVCRIEAERHGEAFDALKAYFSGRHGLAIDRSCRDVTRLRFLSWDPDIRENVHARRFKRYSLAPEAQERAKEAPGATGTAAPVSVSPLSRARREEILAALERVSPDNRQTWLDAGMAIHSECPSLEGYNIWRVWSEFNDAAGKFDEADLSRVWRSFGGRSGTRIETLFKLAYDAGWKGPPPDKIPEGGELPALANDAWLAAPVPPRDPVVEGILDAGTLIEVIAPSKCKKSFFALQLADCIAAGRKFLSWPVPRPRKTLYFNVEMLPDRVHDRQARMVDGLGIPRGDTARLEVVHMRGLRLADPVGSVCATIRARRPEVAVIDPIYLLTGEDESDPVAMLDVYTRFMEVMKATGAAVIIVHHDGKGKAGDRDKRDRGSGSSVMSRVNDGRVLLTPHKDDPDELICVETLCRYTPPSPGVVVRLDNGCLVAVDAECAPDTSKRARPANLKSDAVIDAAIEAVIPDIVANGPFSASSVKQKLRDHGVTNNSKQADAIKRLRVIGGRPDAPFAFSDTGGGRVTFGTTDQLRAITTPRQYSDN